MINKYFAEAKRSIQSFSHIITDYSISEKSYSEEKGFISGVLFFIDNSNLDFAEVINIEKKEKLKYRYHYMNDEKLLVFRYDNTKHFPNLENSPHHKHIHNNVVACSEPKFNQVLKEIEKTILKQKEAK